MKNQIFDKVVQVVIGLFVFALPLVFLPAFVDPYSFGKQVFFLVGTFILFILWVIKAVSEKRLVLKKNFYLPLIGLLFLASLVSTLVNSPNRLSSFIATVGPGSLFLLLVGFLLFLNLGTKKTLLYSLLGSSVILSLLRLIFFLGNLNFPIDITSWGLSLTKSWSPTGSLIAQGILLLAVIPLGFGLMTEELQEKRGIQAVLLFLANLLNLTGLGLSLYLLNTAKPILLPQGTGWIIAVESLKNARLALLGLAPGQFINAFTAFKPLSFNTNEYWNLRFASSSNWYFQLLSEVGLAGLLAYLILTWRVIKDGWQTVREVKASPLKLAANFSLVALIVSQFFIPWNFFLLALFFIVLALKIQIEAKEEKVFDLSPMGNFIFLTLIPPFALWGALLFFGGKVALANYFFLGSLKAASQNNGVKTYNLQIKAIQTDPNVADYRIAYSQTNLALANSLASKKELSDQDRSTITQLIQQSIRESKAAVSVDPRSAAAWENLAGIYRSLINFAQGANDWAASAYQQAINADPLNPTLRLELGSLYYSLRDMNAAVNFFSQAASLKSDYANAHYNLANALREGGDLVNSKREYEITQTLVDVDTNDYQKVTQELEEVKKRLPTPTPPKKPITPETLSTPEPPAEGIKPPLNLPNAGPNVTLTPTP